MARRQQRQVNRIELARVIGYFQFCAGALKDGRYQLLDLYACLHTTQEWGKHTRVKLSAPAQRALQYYWKHPPAEQIGRPWGPQEKTRVM